MMISPDLYVDSIKNLSYEELVNKRNHLILSLHRFEQDVITEEEKFVHPSPEVVYQCENLYLIEVTKLLNDAFNQRLWDEE